MAKSRWKANWSWWEGSGSVWKGLGQGFGSVGHRFWNVWEGIGEDFGKVWALFSRGFLQRAARARTQCFVYLPDRLHARFLLTFGTHQACQKAAQ